MLTPRRNPRPWPRPQPPSLPPNTGDISLRPPQPPPAPSWLQHHLRDLGEGGGRDGLGAGRASGGRGLVGWAGPQRGEAGQLRLQTGAVGMLPCRPNP